MPCGVVDQIAERLRQIVGVDASGEIGRYRSRPGEAATRRRSLDHACDALGNSMEIGCASVLKRA